MGSNIQTVQLIATSWVVCLIGTCLMQPRAVPPRHNTPSSPKISRRAGFKIHVMPLSNSTTGKTEEGISCNAAVVVWWRGADANMAAASFSSICLCFVSGSGTTSDSSSTCRELLFESLQLSVLIKWRRSSNLKTSFDYSTSLSLKCHPRCLAMLACAASEPW